MWVSLFYASGNIVLSVAAYFDPDSPTHPYLDYLGLFMIAVGTGGIKPCVSAFGGNSFKKGQVVGSKFTSETKYEFIAFQ